MTEIQIQNISNRVTNDQVNLLIPALQAQINEDLLPVWGVSANLTFIGANGFSSGAYHCIIKDTADNPNDGGFHTVVDQNQQEIPEARIFMDSIPLIEELASIISHELLEMLVDPWTTRSAPINSNYYVEVADPVSNMTYQKNGILVSNFVTPRYYGFSPTKSVKYDFNDTLSGPLPALALGGYLWELNSQEAAPMWIAHAAADAGGRLNWRLGRLGRNSWRATQTHTYLAPP